METDNQNQGQEDNLQQQQQDSSLQEIQQQQNQDNNIINQHEENQENNDIKIGLIKSRHNSMFQIKKGPQQEKQQQEINKDSNNNNLQDNNSSSIRRQSLNSYFPNQNKTESFDPRAQKIQEQQQQELDQEQNQQQQQLSEIDNYEQLEYEDLEDNNQEYPQQQNQNDISNDQNQQQYMEIIYKPEEESIQRVNSHLKDSNYIKSLTYEQQQNQEEKEEFFKFKGSSPKKVQRLHRGNLKMLKKEKNVKEKIHEANQVLLNITTDQNYNPNSERDQTINNERISNQIISQVKINCHNINKLLDSEENEDLHNNFNNNNQQQHYSGMEEQQNSNNFVINEEDELNSKYQSPQNINYNGQFNEQQQQLDRNISLNSSPEKFQQYNKSNNNSSSVKTIKMKDLFQQNQQQQQQQQQQNQIQNIDQQDQQQQRVQNVNTPKTASRIQQQQNQINNNENSQQNDNNYMAQQQKIMKNYLQPGETDYFQDLENSQIHFKEPFGQEQTEENVEYTVKLGDFKNFQEKKKNNKKFKISNNRNTINNNPHIKANFFSGSAVGANRKTKSTLPLENMKKGMNRTTPNFSQIYKIQSQKQRKVLRNFDHLGNNGQVQEGQQKDFYQTNNQFFQYMHQQKQANMNIQGTQIPIDLQSDLKEMILQSKLNHFTSQNQFQLANQQRDMERQQDQIEKCLRQNYSSVQNHFRIPRPVTHEKLKVRRGLAFRISAPNLFPNQINNNNRNINNNINGGLNSLSQQNRKKMMFA